MAHSFNLKKVKPEPYEYVDYDDAPVAFQEPYFAVPRNPDAQVAPGTSNAPGAVTYEKKIHQLGQIFWDQQNLIELNPPEEQHMIYTAIEKKVQHVNSKVPWTKNFPKAQTTTKWQSMHIEVRRQAIQEHQIQLQQRRNPRRSATMNLKEGAYKDQDEEEIKCDGYFDSKTGIRKKLVKRKKIQKK